MKKKIAKPKSAKSFVAIAEQYVNALSVPNKTVIEVGAGNQLYTALYLIYSGAKKVIVIEPCIDKNATKQLTQYAVEIEKLFPDKIVKEELFGKIKIYKKGADEKNLLSDYNGKIDTIFSHTTLEHIPDLNQIFKNFNQWLKNSGTMYHVVDFVDHLYYPFSSLPLLKFLFNNKFRHLQYSPKTWKRVNDQKTCFMNRKLLPHYRKLAQKYDFEIKSIKSQAAQIKVKIHDDILMGLENINPRDLNAAKIEIVFRKK
ncbi:class I SAM-dependent methyltransferase [Patescibacteria group bacterium]|nr:class I SAM-dependent methyltransferase [Patescibacteria group bacterium]MBU4511798.1 class I SAM-dependent methyltransferase [Patescibacteria group bacterium]